jgi:hypothetical protein
VADTVGIEPVSASEFPANREKNREFRQSCPPSAIFGSKSTRKFNCLQQNSLRNQTGIFSEGNTEFGFIEQGISRPNRQFDWRSFEGTLWRNATNQPVQRCRRQNQKMSVPVRLGSTRRRKIATVSVKLSFELRCSFSRSRCGWRLLTILRSRIMDGEASERPSWV